MHVSIGAVEINIFGAVCALTFAALHALRWRHVRQGYYIPLSLGWLGLCAYWSLIAVSAGPDPMWGRAALAVHLRLILAASMTALALGNAMQIAQARYCARRRNLT